MRPELGMNQPMLDDDGLPPAGERSFNARPLIVLVVIAVLGLGGWMYVNRSDGWMHDVDDGLDVAARDGRNVFVYFGADWCPPCVQYRKHMLSDPDIKTGLAERYVLVKVDLSNRAGPNNWVAQDFDVSVIPTVVVLNADGYEIDRIVGGSLPGWTRRQAGW